MLNFFYIEDKKIIIIIHVLKVSRLKTFQTTYSPGLNRLCLNLHPSQLFIHNIFSRQPSDTLQGAFEESLKYVDTKLFWHLYWLTYL